MKLQSSYLLVAIFSIFLGSQITEGIILVPYWQSLSAQEFYNYYQEFGPLLGQFYTPLTIIAALIPIILSIVCFIKKSSALPYFLVSTCFSLMFIACFYLYFKGANELFYQAAFQEENLRQELIIWSKWHWTRVGLEFLALLFLIFAFQKLNPVE